MDVRVFKYADAHLGAGREAADAFHCVIEKFEPEGVRVGGVENVEYVAPKDELSGSPDYVGSHVACMNQPVEKALPAVVPARGDTDIPASPEYGRKKRSSACGQEAALALPSGKGLAALHGKSPVGHSAGGEGDLLEKEYRFFGKERLPVGTENTRLLLVGEHEKRRGSRVPKSPAPRSAVKGKVQGRSAGP